MNNELEEIKKSTEVDLRNIEERVKAITVKNRDSYAQAVEIAVWNREVIKKVSALREALMKPYEDALSNIKKGFEKLIAPFEEMDEKLLGKMGSYQKTVDLESIRTVYTEAGGRATVSTRVDFEIVDEAKIPREFLIPDKTKIRRALEVGFDVQGVTASKKLVTSIFIGK